MTAGVPALAVSVPAVQSSSVPIVIAAVPPTVPEPLRLSVASVVGVFRLSTPPETLTDRRGQRAGDRARAADDVERRDRDGAGEADRAGAQPQVAAAAEGPGVRAAALQDEGAGVDVDRAAVVEGDVDQGVQGPADLLQRAEVGQLVACRS